MITHTWHKDVVFRTFNTDMNVLFCGRSNISVIFDNHYHYSVNYPLRSLEQRQKYSYMVKPYPNLKEYSIDTFEL